MSATYGCFAGGGEHVAGAIDGGFPAGGAELFQKPGGALLFQKGGRRNAAELQVDFVDPLLLARETLQALAHAGQFGEFAEIVPR